MTGGDGITRAGVDGALTLTDKDTLATAGRKLAGPVGAVRFNGWVSSHEKQGEKKKGE
jgi:hypothetical protein